MIFHGIQNTYVYKYFMYIPYTCIQLYTNIPCIYVPVVPHKAVAEVSKTGNL